jgi:hypothetical protein
MRCLDGKLGVLDLALVRESVLERRDAVWIRVNRLPVDAVAGVHVRPLYERVDVGNEREGICPALDPFWSALIGTLGVAVE